MTAETKTKAHNLATRAPRWHESGDLGLGEGGRTLERAHTTCKRGRRRRGGGEGGEGKPRPYV